VKVATTLAIATAGSVGAAIVADEIEHATTTTQLALSGALRCVRDVLRAAGKTIEAVELVAVCTGPGSFTGLRIGVAFAKSVAQARGLPMLGVSSYDVVDDESNGITYPRVALVEGKRDFFYARIVGDEAAKQRFISGPRESLEEIAGMHVAHLADLSASEQALRIARIARQRAAAGAAGGWQAVEIDYGGRPNAVVNWERRRVAHERGGAASAANFKPR